MIINCFSKSTLYKPNKLYRYCTSLSTSEYYTYTKKMVEDIIPFILKITNRVIFDVGNFSLVASHNYTIQWLLR